MEKDLTRRLACEYLERRDLLAVGDFIGVVDAPSATPQLGSETGTSVAATGDYVAVSSPRDDALGVVDVGQVHLFQVDGTLLTTIPNPVGRPGDRFGASLALFGQTVAVGAPNADLGATDAGAVYLFDIPTGQLRATITNPDPHEFDAFGSSVALSPGRLVVGAPFDDTNGSDSGSAYFFDTATGELLQAWSRAAASPYDRFGGAVAIDGELVAIGADHADVDAIDDGAVYLFRHDSGELLREHRNPSPANFEYFGSSVALDGEQLAVGTFREGSTAPSAGAVYLYATTTGAPGPAIFNPAPMLADYFGESIDLLDDQLVIGARRADGVETPDSGVAYTFSATTGELRGTMRNPTPGRFDFFGGAVALSENVVVVGAYSDDEAAPDAGAAFFFDAETGALQQTVHAPTPSSLDYFGYAVAVSGQTVAVGALQDDQASTDGGAIYLINAETSNVEHVLTNPHAERYANFGNAVAMDGNLVVVGAFRGGDVGEGRAFVFDAVTGDLVSELANPDPAPFDSFGFAVAIHGDIVAVGAHRDDVNGIDTGSVYLYDAVSGLPLGRVDSPDPDPYDQFGYSLALSSELLVVGAANESRAGDQVGGVYLFDLATQILRQTLSHPDPSTSDLFGSSVDIAGDTIAVGAPRKDLAEVDAGAVYLFHAHEGALIATLRDVTRGGAALFGYDLAMTESYLLVGAYQEKSATGATIGACYLYDSQTGLLLGELSNRMAGSSDLFGWSVAAGHDAFVVGAPLADGLGTDRGAVYLYSAHQNGRPIAILSNPFVGREGESLRLSATDSFDVEDAVDQLMFEWDFDFDGIDFDVDAIGSEPEILFEQNFAERPIALRVTDRQGATALTTGTLQIDNVPPQLQLDADTVEVVAGEIAVHQVIVHDVAGDDIQLVASRGTVERNEDGTWRWELHTTVDTVSEPIVLTAEDRDGARTEITFDLIVEPILPLRPSDLNGDGRVDAGDATILFANWGSADEATDLNGDLAVDAADAGLLFAAWTG